MKGFQETIKIYEQGKAYYDALKSVNNLVRDARKVQKTILMVSEITGIYVTNFRTMLADPNFTADELTGISYGYARLLEREFRRIRRPAKPSSTRPPCPCRMPNVWQLSTNVTGM